MEQVVIWGHKLHTHTHSYIHYGFYKAFSYMGIKTFWYDDSDDISNVNFDNSLFITEGQVDKKIPINDKSFYVLHNVDQNKYITIPNKNKMMLQTYTISCINDNTKKYPHRKNTYYDDYCLFTMWGTDLLPNEIKKNIDNLDKINENNERCTYFIGTRTPLWNGFERWCHVNNVKYESFGGFCGKNVSPDENQLLIQKSIISPCLQTKWQIDNEYITCRIFKNISYGKMGITNNNVVNLLFDGKLIYNKNVNKLCDNALIYTNDQDYLKRLKELMEDVLNNHTYLNIIESIIWFFREIKQNNIYICHS